MNGRGTAGYPGYNYNGSHARPPASERDLLPAVQRDRLLRYVDGRLEEAAGP